MIDYPSPAFDDIQGSAMSAVSGIAGWSVEFLRDTYLYIPWFRHDQNDIASFVFQMSHRKDLGTPVDFHIHYVFPVDPGSTKHVYLDYQYKFVNVGDAIPAVSGWSTGQIDITIPATGDANKHLLKDALNINAPANESYSAILMVSLRRVTGTDNYTTSKGYGTNAANFGLLGADCHYLNKKLGSRLEFTD